MGWSNELRWTHAEAVRRSHRGIPQRLACRYKLVRRSRHGVLERYLLAWLGWYPWECPNCGLTFYIHRRKIRHLE